MLRFQDHHRWLALLVLCFAVLTFSCGEQEAGAESIYLHVFNAYPGTDSAEVIGPAGRIASGLEFGERTDEPVAVDRSIGGDLTVILDGAPETFEGDPGIYSLYPQETATLVIGRRDDNSLSLRMLRHIQSISPGCRLVVNNTLSVSNQGIGTYNFILGWNMDHDFSVAGYDQDKEEAELDPDDHRDGMYTEMDRHPYFASFPGTQEGMVWLGPEDEVEYPKVNFETGTVRAPPQTEEYIQCIEERDAAVQAAQEDDEQDIDIEDVLAQFDCEEPRTYTAVLHQPLGEAVYTFHYTPEGVGNTDQQSCDAEHQIYSDFHNIFEGEHGDGRRITHTSDFGISDHYFMVLYGRTVNPLMETWRASDHFTELPDYPGDPDTGDDSNDGTDDGS